MAIGEHGDALLESEATSQAATTTRTIRARRKAEGTLKLKIRFHEDAIQCLATGYEESEIVRMLNGEITVESLDALFSTALGQRRFKYISQGRTRAEHEPKASEARLALPTKVLAKWVRGADDKVEIVAAQELTGIALDEMAEAPKKLSAPATGDDLDELKSAFEGEGEK